MSTRRFLLCASAEAAATRDAEACAFFRAHDGNRGSQWSGVYTDGTRYGIEWDEQLERVFGAAENLPIATAITAEDGTLNWQPLPPPAPVEESTL